MLMPSKITPIQDSVLYGAMIVGLEIDDSIRVNDLYDKVKSKMVNVTDFMEALDLLFLLGRICLNENDEVVKIA